MSKEKHEHEQRVEETSEALQAARLELAQRRADCEAAVAAFNQAGQKIAQLQPIHAEAERVLDDHRLRAALKGRGYEPGRINKNTGQFEPDPSSLALHDSLRAFQRDNALVHEGGLAGHETRKALGIS